MCSEAALPPALPTNVEQSDLNIACFGGHGDAPRVVLAPTGVEDRFTCAIEAVNIARRYNVPVIILSDQSIATRIEAFEEPNIEKICQDISPDLTPIADYVPYALDGRNQPRVAPGTPILSGKYPVAVAWNMMKDGTSNRAPRLHAQMTARRRRNQDPGLLHL